MNSILNVLLEITVFSAVLYGAILLFQKLFRKHISAVMNYAVWALLILRLIMPVTIESGLHLFIIPDEPKQAAYAEASNNNAQPQGYPITYQPTTDNTSFEIPENNETNNTALGSQNQIKPWGIEWQTALVLIWGAGVLFSFGFVAILCRRLRQKIKRCGTAAPRFVLKLVDKCKSDMGIKADIGVSVQGWLKSPALSASFKPMLLLPEHMLYTKDTRQLEFGIRHELTHYLCRDHLTNLLLMVLRCVYWFNPVIYLAFHSMQTDMEIECDARIASRLKDTERTRYIRTMIDLGGSGNIQYVLGMGMSKGGKEMEKRVRGIFMRKNTKLPARMAAVLLAVLMLVTCFTTACRPVPAEKPAASRQTSETQPTSGQDNAPEIITSNDFVRIGTPSHISETYDGFPKLKLTFDANIVVPETTAYPVTEVTEKVFSEEDILSYIDLLVDGDYEMYAGWTQTKDDILSLLTKAKQYEGTERITQGDLDRLQELYDKATNDVENPRISSLSELPEHTSLNIKNKDNIISRVSFIEGRGNYFGYVQDGSVAVYAASMVTDSQYNRNMDGPIEHYRWLQPGEPAISQEDAYAIVQRYMDGLGVDLDLYFAEPCSFIKDLVNKTTGWQFTFTRTISGLQTLYDTEGVYVNPDAPPSSCSPWEEEVFNITIDKDGLCSLFWKGASEISRTVAESAQLEPFENIKKRIADQLNCIYGTHDNGSGGLEMEVTEIRLGISMITVKDRSDLGEYLPTWYVRFIAKFKNEEEWFSGRIMFSAIDGSYIEPRIIGNKIMGNKDTDSSESSGD